MRMFQTKVVEKVKTHILCLVTFLKNNDVYEIIWRNLAELEKATSENMAHLHFALGT
jgi:hypothetical protein